MAEFVSDGSGLLKKTAAGNLIRQGDSTITLSILDALGPEGADDFVVRAYDPLIENNPDVVGQTAMLWSDVANIAFVPVADSANADIRVGAATLTFGALGIALTDHGIDGAIRSGAEVYVDRAEIDLEPGGLGYFVLIHEFGHAIGLDHPAPFESVDGPFLESRLDNERFTVMSSDGFPGSSVHAMAPMTIDILAIQALYGPNLTTRTGDTIYGFNSNARFDDSNEPRPDYDFGQTPRPITTIWDAGGTDTIDASGYDSGVTINLTPGSYSSVGGLTANLGIAFGTIIENAIGGSKRDLLIGNAADNKLEGRSGGDVLAGLGGADELGGDDGGDILLGGGGADVLRGDSGDDALLGGRGDDVLVAEPAADGRRIDGGPGSDTLVLGGSGTDLDLTATPNSLYRNIEEIDLTGGGSNTLTLSENDVLAITGSPSGALVVTGDANDSVVDAAPGGFTDTGADLAIDGQSYSVYAGNTTAATLAVDNDISTALT